MEQKSYTDIALELAPFLLVLMDPEAKILTIDGAGLQSSGLDIKAMQGESALSIKELPVQKSHFRKAARGEAVCTTIRSGDIFWEVLYIPKLEEAEPHILAYITDVTTRVQVELDLDEQLFAKSEEIRKMQVEQKEMLDHLRQAVLTFDSDLTINAGYSKHLEVILAHKGESLVGMPVFEYLFDRCQIPEEIARRFRFDLQTLFGSDELQWLCSAHAFPKEVSFDRQGDKRIFKLSFEAIYRDGKIGRIMLIVEDITELLALEKQAAERQKELKKIADLLAVDESVYGIFRDEASKIIAQCHSSLDMLITGQDEVIQTVNHLFRYVHTLKGCAGLFKLGEIQNAAHEFETYLDEVRAGQGLDSPQTKEVLSEKIDFIQQEVHAYEKLREKMFKGQGQKDFQKFSPAHMSWIISLLNRLIQSLQNPDMDLERVNRLKSEISESLRSVNRTPLRFYADSFSSLVQSVAEKAEKQVSPLKLDSNVHYFDKKFMARISDMVVHSLTNAISHGIESPEERQQTSKAAQGQVTLQIHQDEQNTLRIIISDDGKGIDPNKIAEIAVEKGVLTTAQAQTLSPQEKVHLVFAPGFTSKQEADMQSGRGVGMDAVDAIAKDLGGKVRIDSKVGSGTQIIIEIPHESGSLIQDLGLVNLGQLASKYLNTAPELPKIADAIIVQNPVHIHQLFMQLQELPESSALKVQSLEPLSSGGKYQMRLAIEEGAVKDLGAQELLQSLQKSGQGFGYQLNSQSGLLTIEFASLVPQHITDLNFVVINHLKSAPKLEEWLAGFFQDTLGIRNYKVLPGLDSLAQVSQDDITVILFDDSTDLEDLAQRDLTQVAICAGFSDNPDLISDKLISTLPAPTLIAKWPDHPTTINQILELAYLHGLMALGRQTQTSQSSAA